MKTALENEGYEGEAEGLVFDATGEETARRERVVSIRPQFARLYTHPFKGKIYLPRFCVKEGKGKDAEYRPLDYFEHLISRVDVGRFAYSKIDWPLKDEIKKAKDRFYRISLGTDLTREYETDVDLLETDGQVLAWLAASLRFDFLSTKQIRAIVGNVYEQLARGELLLKDRLATVKSVVRDKIERFIEEQLDAQTEGIFRDYYDRGSLHFYLECAECRHEIPSTITISAHRPLVPLTHDDGQPMQRSLFDFVERENQNEYEQAVALVLDKNADVLWWYRNLVGPENFMIQGYRRHKIYPDFVVQQTYEGKPCHRVLVIESKGKHLEGNPDTTYKRKVAGYFDRVGKKVTWQQLGADFKDHVFRFQVLDEAQPLGRDWQDELRDMLAG